jgi:hypothetical protein
MVKDCKPEYLAKAELLTEEETERLLSRMSGKLPRRLVKGKVSQLEALAVQLELEEEQLEKWRAMMQILKDKEAAREAKAQEKLQTPVKSKATVKTSAKPKEGEKKAKTE